jgi:hypothetical protein
MLIIVTAVAIFLGLAVSLGAVLLASLVWCVLPTPLVICALFDRGDRQAFSIGALIPWLELLVFRFPAIDGFIALTVWLLVTGAVCGAIAVVTRRWAVSPRA